jgi:hypothetical protein
MWSGWLVYIKERQEGNNTYRNIADVVQLTNTCNVNFVLHRMRRVMRNTLYQYWLGSKPDYYHSRDSGPPLDVQVSCLNPFSTWVHSYAITCWTKQAMDVNFQLWIDKMATFNLNLSSYTRHIGHPRVTVACQSGSALFTLGLNLAKSTPLATRRKVANHSPKTPRGKQTSSKDIWSGGFPFVSNTFTHLHRGHFRYSCTTIWTLAR